MDKTQYPKGVVPFKLPSFGRKKKLIRYAIYLVIILVVVNFVFSSMFIYVEPGEFALKEVRIGMQRGIQKTVYPAGYVFRKPFGMEYIHKFPRTILEYELTNYPDADRRRLPKYYAFDKAAHIQTSDGFFVDVDCTILYHITDPYLVLTTVGPGRMYEINGVVPKAEPVLKQSLGELTTEEFYNSPLRFSRSLVARDMLNDQLNSKGITVDHALIRYFQYSEEIQKNIEEKKLKDQLVFKNQAEARAATEEANLKRISEEGEANFRVKLQEGESYITEKKAEIDLYARSRHAEADLLVKLAEAKKTDLKNKALQTGGSDRLVGLKMAEVMKGLEMIVLPSDGKTGLNPLDLRKSLELFEVMEQQP